MNPTLLSELESLLAERVSTSDAVREHHGKDDSHHDPLPPDAVVFPKTTEEVARIVALCGARGIPVIPFGAGTSIEGLVLAVHGGVSIDLSRMNEVLVVRTEDMDVTVGPGVTRLQLERHLKGMGLFFPVDPGADATLGGMAATGASGTTTVRYGTMRDNVVSLVVVLADGRIVRTGGRARKSSAGYDLTNLMVGSEGTLGIITELTLRLHPVPEVVRAAVCPFPDIGSAVASVIRAVQLGIPVARAELLDATTIEAVNGYAGLGCRALPTVFFEFHGSAAEVEDHATAVRVIASELGAVAFDEAVTQDDRSRLWQARHDAYPALLALRPGSRGFTTDVCVPISKLADCIVETLADLEGLAVPAALVGHVGDGNFHLAFMIDPDRPEELAAVEAVNERLVRRAIAMEGTCTGEHGVGLGKMKFLLEEHGEGLDVMRAIKGVLDPDNLLNPGKVVPA